MPENLRKRVVAILLVGLLHVGLIFFGLNVRSRTHERVTDGSTMTLYFFEERPRLPSAKLPATPAGIRAAQRPPESRLTTISPLVQPEEPEENAISAAPRIDWAEQAKHAAEDALARRDADSRLRSFDFPKFSEPKRSPQGHVLGDVERFEGGETIDWINNRCYYTNRPIADFARDMGPGVKELALPVCKHR